MPRQKKLDKDTKKVLELGGRIKELTQSAGWGDVRNIFLKKAAEMLNMKDINILNTNVSVIHEIGARQLAAARLIEILNEIQGTAEQFDANSTLTEELEESGYIWRGK